MDCKLCIDELDAFLEGTLPEARRLSVEEHLNSCEECRRNYNAMRMANEVILEEKLIRSNPYLSTRIMSVLNEEMQPDADRNIPAYQKVVQTSLIGLAIAASVFIGIMAGNVYKPYPQLNVPEEMIYMNDAVLESVNVFTE